MNWKRKKCNVMIKCQISKKFTRTYPRICEDSNLIDKKNDSGIVRQAS
jgi:hypothetical protein